MGQQLLQEQGVLPQDFYSTSLSDLAAIQTAKSRKERVQDPLELIRSLEQKS